MTAEYDFIRGLESFLDTQFDDFAKKRIESMLKEYYQNLPAIIIKEKEIVEVNVNVALKKLCTREDLYKDALELCEIHSIDIADFMKPRWGKSLTHIVDARRLFCYEMKQKYIISHQQLKHFFDVNHTTISYYVNGKNKRPLKRDRA